ncbi:MAG: signal peptidase II [Myxococcales bacterium]|nr:signal peptidase II [Myxococcales bacterium]
MARRSLASLFVLLSLAGLVGCDHATKAAAVEKLASGPVSLAPHVDLVYAENHDVAFSILSHFHLTPRPFVLAIVPLLLTIALAVRLYQTRRGPRLERAAYVFLLAGALGNVIDRLARGFVVDFIRLPHWPVFNVADVLVVVGMVLLGAAGYRRARRPDPDPTS